MKNKITILAIMLSVALGVFPAQLFAQDYDYSSSYNYDTSVSSGYDYTSPTNSSYNYTSPTVSSYDYTSPTVSSYNYTSPTVSSYDYTSPTNSSYNYTNPIGSTNNYVTPNYSSYPTTYTTTGATSYTVPNYNSYPTTYGGTPQYTAPSYTTGGSQTTYPTTNTVVCSDGNAPVNGSCVRTTTITTTNNTICSDGRAPVNGSCNRVTTITGTNSTVCSDGSAPTNGSCNRITTISGTNSIVCSDGSYPTNGSCNRVTTITGTNSTICSDGRTPINGSCNRVNTIQTINNTFCSDGSAPTNGSCVRTNTIPTVTNNVCSDGSYPTNGSCVRINVIPVLKYQTCWDGSTIPTGSVCPAQFKYCANGTSVPISQACYVPPNQTYTPPQIVKFNNVVTSVATEISKTSGRCNGIGLIANNTPSTGWFEYGETPSLGRTTATANIGSANTAPFSNVLASLKPSTRYYCRAVMQNQFGLVKGEIVGFTTKATVTTYVKPIIKPAVTKKPVTPVKTNTITCSDGSTVKTKNTSSATLLNQGEKLIAVQVEKIEGNLISGNVVRYKVTYKNLTDTKLSGVLIKVTLPQEIVLAGATAGNYDLGTRTLTLNQDTVDPYTEGVILITGNVQKDAPIGKTVVTNVYVAYTVPGTSTQDEVTAYVVGSIMPNTIISGQDTGAKKVIGQNAAQSFMPNTLIEWLALLAIMFIIFILGRSVYASYKDDEGSKHH